MWSPRWVDVISLARSVTSPQATPVPGVYENEFTTFFAMFSNIQFEFISRETQASANSSPTVTLTLSEGTSVNKESKLYLPFK